MGVPRSVETPLYAPESGEHPQVAITAIYILAPITASGEVVKHAGLLQPQGSCQAPTMT